MKQLLIQSIAAAALLATAGVAQAAAVVVPVGQPYNGMVFAGSGTLSFSADLLGALDTGKVSVARYGAADVSVQKDSDGFYTSVAASAPFTSLTIDSETNNVLGASTSGGATQTAPVLKSVSSGGSLTVTDLSVDLVNKRVYATLIGGNGVGTINNFYLWDIASITGATTVGGPGTYVTTLSGLSITTDGFNKFTQSLGLLNLGKAALNGVTDFGTITSVIVPPLLDWPPVIPPIVSDTPEPSTYALMGMGLAGMMLVRRRQRSQHAAH